MKYLLLLLALGCSSADDSFQEAADDAAETSPIETGEASTGSDNPDMLPAISSGSPTPATTAPTESPAGPKITLIPLPAPPNPPEHEGGSGGEVSEPMETGGMGGAESEPAGGMGGAETEPAGGTGGVESPLIDFVPPALLSLEHSEDAPDLSFEMTCFPEPTGFKELRIRGTTQFVENSANWLNPKHYRLTMCITSDGEAHCVEGQGADFNSCDGNSVTCDYSYASGAFLKPAGSFPMRKDFVVSKFPDHGFTMTLTSNRGLIYEAVFAPYDLYCYKLVLQTPSGLNKITLDFL